VDPTLSGKTEMPVVNLEDSLFEPASTTMDLNSQTLLTQSPDLPQVPDASYYDSPCLYVRHAKTRSPGSVLLDGAVQQQPAQLGTLPQRAPQL
jgi:hypothetical protein